MVMNSYHEETPSTLDPTSMGKHTLGAKHPLFVPGRTWDSRITGKASLSVGY